MLHADMTLFKNYTVFEDGAISCIREQCSESNTADTVSIILSGLTL